VNLERKHRERTHPPHRPSRAQARACAREARMCFGQPRAQTPRARSPLPTGRSSRAYARGRAGEGVRACLSTPVL
jgi:hypothetical protein